MTQRWRHSLTSATKNICVTAINVNLSFPQTCGEDPNPEVFWLFSTKGWEFLLQILHAHYTFLSALDYKCLFSYLQLWRSYAIGLLKSATIQFTCSKFSPSAETHASWRFRQWTNLATGWMEGGRRQWCRCNLDSRGSVGIGYPGTVQFFGSLLPQDRVNLRTQFCRHIYRVNQNKSPWKILRRVAVGVVRESRKFSGHP